MQFWITWQSKKKFQGELESLFNIVKMEIQHIKTSGGAAKAVFTGAFIALAIYIRNIKRFKNDDLSFHLKKIKKNKWNWK